MIGSLSTASPALDYLGVGFFAVSGAIAAVERRQDIVAMLFFGAITGIGGGTLRDLMIGAPVFWVHRPEYLIVCLVASALVWLTKGRGVNRRWLLWMDAIGLSAYAVVGAVKAADAQLSPPVCVAMGVLTACFGGVLRDVLSEQPSVLLRREIYVTAAIGAASVYMAALGLGLNTPWCVAAGMLAGFILRGGALLKGWKLPVLEASRPDGDA
jgi:uncharacterized membrane protein YeiH